MDISIRPGLTLCLGVGVKGIALLTVYLIFALAFLAVPEIP